MARKKRKLAAVIGAITDSPWFLPALLGLGAFMFVSATGNNKPPAPIIPPPSGGTNYNDSSSSSGDSSSSSSGSGTSSGSGSGTSSGSGWGGSGGTSTTPIIQYTTPISSANADTIKRIKQEINSFINTMSNVSSMVTYGVPYLNISSIPNPLTINSNKDSLFKYALKWVFIVNYNIAYETNYSVSDVPDSLWDPYTRPDVTLNYVTSTINNIYDNLTGV